MGQKPVLSRLAIVAGLTIGMLASLGAAAFAATYTWNQTGTASWATSTNWTPTRTTPATSDILVFNNGATTTATNVPTQSVAQLLVSGNTAVTLDNGATAGVLTIGGGVTGADLSVAGGSALNLSASGNAAFSLSILTGNTGSVSGSMTFSAASANTGLQVLAADAASLTFNSGSVVTQQKFATGSLFGTAGTAGTTVFASGSVFDQVSNTSANGGANPFGLGQPSSKVTFQSGSLLKYEIVGGTPAFSGRNYGDFEFNTPAGISTPTGGNAVTMGNLTVDAGTLNFNSTATPGHSIKGNIVVASGATLNFSPASAATINFNGTSAQTITNSGTFSSNSLETFAINNASGINLGSNLTVGNATAGGGISFTSGKISTGANTLTLGSGAGISGAGSGTGYVVGNLQKAVTGAGTVGFDVGTSSDYSPVSVNFTSVGGAGNLTAAATAPISAPVSASGLSASKYVNRSWTLTNGGITSPAYSATFNFVPADVQGGANTNNLIVAKNTGGTWSNPTVGTRTSTSTQATGLTAFSDFELGEAGCPTITLSPAAGALPGATTGSAYNQTISSSGGAAPVTYAVTSGSLPAGISLASGGALTGTPTALGSSSFTVTATDANGCTGSAAYTLAVTCGAITLAPASLPGGTTGVAYGQSITASGGTDAFAFAVTSGTLPAGLALSSGGAITGTPTAAGTANFDITATDANSCTGVRSYSIVISCPTIAVTPAAGALPGANTTDAYTQAITASGGTSPYTFAVTAGALPAGLTLASGGALTGTATALGAASFTVTATDAHGCTGSAAYTLDVTCGAVTVAPASLPAATTGTAYSQSITASGGTGPYTFAVTTGALPAGLSLASGGGLTGTPTASGTANFDVTATDANACTGVRSYSIVVSCPAIALSPGALPNGTQDSAYSQTITASGGTGPHTFAVTSGTLPAGLALASGGALTGTPTAAGTASFDVTATDANACTGVQSYSLTIDAPLSSTVSPVSATACVTPAHPCQTVPVNIARGDATGMRLFHVTFQLSADLALCSTPGASVTEGAYLSAANPNTTFLVTANGGGSYTVDGTINGSPCGATAASGNLFNISVAGTGTSGTGTVTLTALTLRDCANNTLASTIGGPASVTIDTTPVTVAAIPTPANVVELATVTITPSATLTACATGPVTWSVAPALPAGATFNTSTGEIQWTPACGTAGTYGPFTLTATAASGDAASSNAFTIVVAHRTYTIAASAGAGGSISPSGSVVVNCGADQAFTITPDACHTIADVLVDGVSQGPIASYTFTNVTGNHTIAASFNLVSYTIAASAGAGGTITPSGTVAVGCGANQSFSIAPDACHTIADVLVDGVSQGAITSYTFTNVTGNHTIAASFNLVSYTITASAGAGGTITPSGAVAVGCGANQSFAIAPDACHDIADVLVDGVSQGPLASYTFTNVTGNHTIAASFALETYTIAASAGAGGAISPSGSVSVNCGADQAFTITPDACHTIADVLVDGVSQGAITSYTFTNVTGNHTIAASFNLISYTITASAGAGGSISPSGNVSVGCGANQAFAITPAACYTIADVLVDGVSQGPIASYTFTNVTGNHTIAASFTLTTYTIVASAGSGGSITPSGNVSVNCGANQSFTIAPDACHDIADVLVDGASQGAITSYTFTNVTGNHTIAASFTLKTYTIVASAGTGGSITPSGNVSVGCGANQSFTIAGDACHTIADVLVDGVSQGPVTSYTFTNVTGNHTIAASFNLVSYTITASAGAGGTITPSGAVVVGCGANRSFTITGDGCHTIADVLVDGVSQGPIASYTFTNVTGNHTIAASFTLTTYTIVASAGAGGSITPSGNVSVNCGANQSFTIAPDACHDIADVLVDGVSQGPLASYTFTNVTGNHTIAASFTLKTYTITASAGTGGTIAPSGGVSVGCGANQSFTIAGDACHTIADVLVDGVSQGAIASYTFTNVTGNHTIAASFVHVAAVVPAPAAVSATQVLLGNPPGSRTGIVLHFGSVVGATSYMIYRAPYGHYPGYDDNGGAAPVAPTTWPPAAPWTLTGVSADGGSDTPPTRDFWYYVVYAENACGDVSVASSMTGGTLDYHLGDVSDGTTPGTGDNLVDAADISLLGAHYGINLAPNDPYGYLDVGPTSTNYVDGRPLTDDRVDFEDLVMFAINFGEVTTAARTAPPAKTDATAATKDELTLFAPARVAPGDDVAATLSAQGTGLVQAMSVRLTWNPAVVALDGATAGALLAGQNGVLLSATPGTFDLAVLGTDQALVGAGTLATVRFKVIAAGDPGIDVAGLDARDTRNRKVVMGASRIVEQAAPTVTTLQPVAPNPSRGTATLSFSLAQRGLVDVSIYSVDGRLVRTLLHGVKEAGVYALPWDGRDAHGAVVSGGVFFAHMTTDHAKFTRTLTRVR